MNHEKAKKTYRFNRCAVYGCGLMYFRCWQRNTACVPLRWRETSAAVRQSITISTAKEARPHHDLRAQQPHHAMRKCRDAGARQSACRRTGERLFCHRYRISMGSLGESYSVLMNFVPRSYRVQRIPQDAYDTMIFVANATPIEIE